MWERASERASERETLSTGVLHHITRQKKKLTILWELWGKKTKHLQSNHFSLPWSCFEFCGQVTFRFFLCVCLSTALLETENITEWNTEGCRQASASKRTSWGISLAVRWLRLQASNAGGEGSIPGLGIKIPCAAEQPSPRAASAEPAPQAQSPRAGCAPAQDPQDATPSPSSVTKTQRSQINIQART